MTLLYALTIGAGLYLGIRAYGEASDGRLPLPWVRHAVSAHSARAEKAQVRVASGSGSARPERRSQLPARPVRVRDADANAGANSAEDPDAPDNPAPRRAAHEEEAAGKTAPTTAPEESTMPAPDPAGGAGRLVGERSHVPAGRPEAAVSQSPGAVRLPEPPAQVHPQPAAPQPAAPKSVPHVPPAVRPAPAPPGAHVSERRDPVAPMEIDHGPGRRPEVALTFDAGADYRPARKILDTLAAHGVRATFFLTGEWVKRNPKTAQRIAADGHEIGNHSWNHPAFTGLTPAAMRDQLDRTSAIIQSTVGRPCGPYFRPPLGARNAKVLRTVGDEGYVTIYWTFDSRDSVDRGITAAQIRDRVLSKIRPGSIVLLHCGSQASADALPEILDALRSRGLHQVPIGQLLAE